ncbi:MAG: P-II family nitrogen regulator [Dehalococcoidia bacterium]
MEQGNRFYPVQRHLLPCLLLPKSKVEVVVLDEDVARILNAITTAGRTREMADGSLVPLPVENAVRVRIREEGANAI